MYNLSLPISLSRFGEALKSLPAQNLELKVAELRNSIAHLDYSNQQLKIFTQESLIGQQDQDCVDAIKENESLIARNLEMIKLVRVEYERRGIEWMEFNTDNEFKPTDEETVRSGNLDRADMEGRKRNNGTTEHLQQDGETHASQEITMMISGESNHGEGPEDNTLHQVFRKQISSAISEEGVHL